mmetsp:Transcript_39520/g.102306  ORF Transcript_39520/g.102306 Transcript_39520/m.102306 type:complete len:208 (+) Transcript_39520:35-658(+)
MSLIVWPPGPISGATSSTGTGMSSSVEDVLVPTPATPPGRGLTSPGGLGLPAMPGLGMPSGMPLPTRASLIIASVFSTSPTIVTVPSGSCGWWSILTSAPLLTRMSLIVSPPLPMRARIWMPSILRILNLSEDMPGGGCGSFFSLGIRSDSQSGTPAGPSWSHFDFFFFGAPSSRAAGAAVDDGSLAGGWPPSGMGVEHCGQMFFDR